MALDLTVDNLDGVSEEHKALYVADGEKFKLDVSGIPEPEDVSGLKSALEKEKENAKEATRKLAAFEKDKTDKTNTTLKEKEQWKELATNLETELKEKDSQLIDGKKARFTDKIVNVLTKDEKKAKLLATQIGQHLEVVEGKTTIIGLAGVETGEQLTEHLKENYAFLTDGSQAAGGGASGNRGGMPEAGLKTKQEVRDMSEGDRLAYYNKFGHMKHKE